MDIAIVREIKTMDRKIVNEVLLAGLVDACAVCQQNPQRFAEDPNRDFGFVVQFLVCSPFIYERPGLDIPDGFEGARNDPLSYPTPLQTSTLYLHLLVRGPLSLLHMALTATTVTGAIAKKIAESPYVIDLIYRLCELATLNSKEVSDDQMV